MRNPRLVLILALVLVVVVVGLAWLTVASTPEPGPAASQSPSPSEATSAPPSATTSSPQTTPTAAATPTPPPATSPPDEPSAEDDGAAAAPAPPTPAPGDAPTGGDEEAEQLTLRFSAEELSGAATRGLPPEAPVEAIDLAPRSGPGGAAVLDVRADVRDLPVELTGEIAVEVAGGRLAPRLVDAQVGPFGLPEAVRAAIDDVLAELGDDLVDPGWQIEDVRVVDGELVFDARRTSISS